MSDAGQRSFLPSPPLATAMGVGAGVATAGQAWFASTLTTRIGDPLQAAAVTVCVGTVVLLLALLVSDRMRRGLTLLRGALVAGRLAWPWLAGSVGGVYFVLTQGAVVGTLGVALFSVGVVGGLLAGGLVFDIFGIAGTGRIKPSPLRIFGVALSLSALAWAPIAGADAALALVPFLIAVSAGLVQAFSAGANGRIVEASESPAAAAFVNHAIGAVAVTVALVVVMPFRGPLLPLPAEPWLYTGGLLGVAILMTMSVVVRVLGVLNLSVAVVAGQLAGALILDAIVPGGAGVSALSLASAALTALAAVIVYFDRRRNEGPFGTLQRDCPPA